MTALNVVPFPAPDYIDPVKMLRNLADQIADGDFGEVGSIGVVIYGDTLEVFGGGIENGGLTINALLQAASLRFARALERHGRD